MASWRLATPKSCTGPSILLAYCMPSAFLRPNCDRFQARTTKEWRCYTTRPASEERSVLGMLNICRIAVSVGITPNVTPEFQPEISGASSLPPNLRGATYSRSAGTNSFAHTPPRRGAKHGRKRNSGKQGPRYHQSVQG